jgi:hypothetical protein
MFQKEEKKLKGFLLHSKWRTSLQEFAGLTVHFEGTEGESALLSTCNCHAPNPRVPVSLAPLEVRRDKFIISRNPDHSLYFLVHTKFSRSRFDERFAAINHLPRSSARNGQARLRRE